MKIIYNENPLRTSVELDEHDREVFRLKLKIEELQNMLFDAHFNLQDGDYFNRERARQAVDPEKYIQEDNAEKVYVDKRVDSIFEYSIEELQGIHSGDCTCQPCSCLKCRAEDILGIDTLKPFPGKHELAKIDAAFSYRENDEIKTRSLSEALIHLKEYKIPREKPESWVRFTQEYYESIIPRWEQEQVRAYEYLKNYANEHFQPNCGSCRDSGKWSNGIDCPVCTVYRSGAHLDSDPVG